MIQNAAQSFKIFSVLILLFSGTGLLAEPVYRKADENSGVPFYSSKKIGTDFEEASLPKINKAEMQLIPAAQATCDGHDAIDCNEGADIDGSVICKDGFRESVERFNFMCRYASLTVSGFGERASRKDTLPVFVRNSKPVTAMKPVVTYISDMGYEAVLEGPEEVAPYAVVEFKLPSHDAVVVGKKIDKTRFAVTCENCGDELRTDNPETYENIVRSGENALQMRDAPKREDVKTKGE